METIARGTAVLISKADDYHNGDVGEVISEMQQSASCVLIGQCVHAYHNSVLRQVPEQDAVPGPVNV